MKNIFAFALLIVMSGQPAIASYDMNGGELTGDFATQYGMPLTIACWGKYTVHPVSDDWAAVLSNDTTLQPHLAIKVPAVDDRFQATSDGTDADAAAAFTGTAGQFDGVWVPFVGTFTSTTSRNIYVNTIAGTGDNPTTSTVGTALDHVTLGAANNGGGDWETPLAECAMWDVVLSAGDITDYLGGECAANIDPTNLIGYWPLDTDNTTQVNEGVDSGGDLTDAGAAVFDADHPTITCDAGSVIAPLSYYLESN